MFSRRCFDFLELFLADWLSVFSRGTVPYVLSLYDSKSCIFLMVLCFSLEINWVYSKEWCLCYFFCLNDVSSLRCRSSACLLLRKDFWRAGKVFRSRGITQMPVFCWIALTVDLTRVLLEESHSKNWQIDWYFLYKSLGEWIIFIHNILKNYILQS